MDLKILKTSGGPGHVVAGEMSEKIKAVIYEYADRVPLALTIGVLEIVKIEVINDHEL